MEYTEEQVQEMLEKAKAEKEAELVAKHNQEMANLRQKDKEEKEKAVAKATEEAKLSAEELASKKADEERKAREQEIAELKAFKQKAELKDALEKAECPTLFINDSRLLNSTSENRDEVIKTIKEEWEKTLPNGAGTDTNFKNKGNPDEKDEFASMRNLGLQSKK